MKAKKESKKPWDLNGMGPTAIHVKRWAQEELNAIGGSGQL